MSRVLLIAPVLTHPSDTGAGARVRYMAAGLAELGHEVHYLHLQQQLGADLSAMERHWQDRLHVFRSMTPAGLLGRVRRKATRVAGKTFHLNLPVDCYFDPEAARYVETLAAAGGFDAVILSYVFYSRLLEFVPSGVRKLIDTHDVFSDRYRLYRMHGQASEFFSTTRRGEATALARADAVLAIQQWDASHFRSLGGTPVAVVGHLAPVAEPPLEPPSTMRTLLFVGGSMGINVHGVTWFLEEVFPTVRRRVPDAELWLAGGIGERMLPVRPGIRRLGFVDALADVYQHAAVVVNPQRFGTGLSIKSVDALLHGRPLVTTTSGARGLEEGVGTAFRQADAPDAFAEALVELLTHPGRAAALAGRALEYARAYHRRQLRALDDVVKGP